MALFSEDLKTFQELEERYRQELAEYQAAAASYNALLERGQDDPSLPKLYAEVQEKNEKARKTYGELESLRRKLAPGVAS
jgi:uncharacterized protein YeaO (DUF488 family)